MKAILLIIITTCLTFQAKVRCELLPVAVPYLSGEDLHLDMDSLLAESKVLYNQGRKDSALLLGSQIVEKCEAAGNRLPLVRALVNLSTLQQDRYQYEEALRNLARAEKLLKNTDPAGLQFDIKNNQGLMYFYMGNDRLATRYFNEINDTFLNKLDHEQKCTLHNNLALVYLQKGDFLQAELLLKKAGDEATKANSSSAGTLTAFNLGKLYFSQKHYAAAWDFIMKSLREFQDKGEAAKAEEASRLLGTLYMEQGDHDFAQSYFEQSMELALELGNSRILLENYRNIFTNYSLIRKKSNNMNYLLLELEYFKKWAYLNDSLYQDQTTERIMELEKKYETEKKNSQISLLEKEKQMAEDQIRSGKIQRRYLSILVVLILVVLGFFIYSFSYYRRMTYLLQKQSRRIMTQQAQITRQNEKLHKAVGTQNKLFSIIAHDLRSPLVSISNISKLVNLYIRNNRFKEAGELSRQMDRKNDHLIELTDNLLSWTKSQSENFTPVLEKIELREVVNECFKIYETMSSDKEITLAYRQDHECWLLADRNMLQTILRNLVNNAIKFTPRQGRIEIFCKHDLGLAKVTIRDTGIGISKEKLETIFEIDTNNTQSGTEGEKSSGLGLSVCKEFTEIMGGSIYVESEENSGSSFIFSIPEFQSNNEITT